MARIFVVGSGVVGTATGRGFVAMGHQVSFIDMLPSRVVTLRGPGLDARVDLDLRGEQQHGAPADLRHRCATLLEGASGKQLGHGFALASNPEFLRAASAAEDFR